MTSIVVGFLHPDEGLSPLFAKCLRWVYLRDGGRQPNRWLMGEFDMFASANIAGPRCDIVQKFLDLPDKPEWLWMVDSDMTFDNDILDRFMEVADPKERPIIGALCFGARPMRMGMGENAAEWRNAQEATVPKLFPTIYSLDPETKKLIHWQSYPQDALIQAHSTGAACLFIHRSVLEDPRWKEDGHPHPWFRETRLGDEYVSEDHFFCLTAQKMGYPLHIDTGIKTGHVKTHVLDEDLYLRTRTVPPAVERVTVIVPVLNRPQNAEPFLRSLEASTGLVEVVAVCSEEDDAKAWEAVDTSLPVDVIRTEKVTFAEKVNIGAQYVTDPWVFITGDDVIFRPGWLDHAQHVARLQGATVVGTNDLGNRPVMLGEHGTHLLIRRDYIEEQGASWDGPGVVCHEGYRHWFVDNEIVLLAKQRGLWASARASVVEHLHPMFGKAEVDATYELGTKHRIKDYTHFKRRLKDYAGA